MSYPLILKSCYSSVQFLLFSFHFLHRSIYKYNFHLQCCLSLSGQPWILTLMESPRWYPSPSLQTKVTRMHYLTKCHERTTIPTRICSARNAKYCTLLFNSLHQRNHSHEVFLFFCSQRLQFVLGMILLGWNNCPEEKKSRWDSQKKGNKGSTSRSIETRAKHRMANQKL